MSDLFAPYAHALAALAIWAILVAFLGGMSTVGRTPEGRSDCGKPKRNYADPVYRRERAFMNAVESSGPFIAATVAAMLVGASAFWVNILASLFIVARLAMIYVHVATENQPMRSATWAVGLLCILGLAVLALIGAFTL